MKVKAAASALRKESPDSACDWSAEIILSKMLRQQAFGGHLARKDSSVANVGPCERQNGYRYFPTSIIGR